MKNKLIVPEFEEEPGNKIYYPIFAEFEPLVIAARAVANISDEVKCSMYIDLESTKPTMVLEFANEINVTVDVKDPAVTPS